MNVRTAVIPVAGLGTRFLPVTKTIPKEMLPLVDRPLITFAVQEAAEAGIEHIVLVSAPGKAAIEDFFDVAPELEARLERDQKLTALKELHYWQNLAKFSSVRQNKAMGLGHAILCAKDQVGNEPFAVLLPDEVMMRTADHPLPTQQLCEYYNRTKVSCVSVMSVHAAEVHKYGIVEFKPSTNLGAAQLIRRAVEKPTPEQAPSNWALPGRYVFSSEIFVHLEQLAKDVVANSEAKPIPGPSSEVQLTAAINMLAQKTEVHALPLQAHRFDAGDKFGYLKAQIEFGLKHPEVAKLLRNYLAEMARGILD